MKEAITLLDGSVGQELVKKFGKKPTPLWSTEIMLKNPEMVSNIHSAYFEAGATIATTNSYTILRDRLKHFNLEHEVHNLWSSSVEAACNARNNFGSGRVAGSNISNILDPLFRIFKIYNLMEKDLAIYVPSPKVVLGSFLKVQEVL